MALSSTFHWMFDRGLISIDDDYSLLLKRNAIPGSVLSLVNDDRRLRLLDQGIYYPHPRFLEYQLVMRKLMRPYRLPCHGLFSRHLP